MLDRRTPHQEMYMEMNLSIWKVSDRWTTFQKTYREINFLRQTVVGLSDTSSRDVYGNKSVIMKCVGPLDDLLENIQRNKFVLADNCWTVGHLIKKCRWKWICHYEMCRTVGRPFRKHTDKYMCPKKDLLDCWSVGHHFRRSWQFFFHLVKVV